MAAPVAKPDARPFAPNSIIWERKGPLPVWAWALLVLGLVLAWTWWRRNRIDAQSTAAYTGSSTPLPGDQTAPPVFIVPPATPPAINVPVTVVPHPQAPPATVPTAPPAGGAPPPTAPPGGSAPATSPPGGYVTVTKYPDNTAPKESTLWDIAAAWLPQGASNWQLIWSHPLNADLARRRGKPEYIQPQDSFFVPGKLASPR